MFAPFNHTEAPITVHAIGHTLILSKADLHAAVQFPFDGVLPLGLFEGEEVSLSSWGAVGLLVGLWFA